MTYQCVGLFIHKNIALLNLDQEHLLEIWLLVQDRITAWSGKKLHDRIFAVFSTENLDETVATEWMRTKGLSTIWSKIALHRSVFTESLSYTNRLVVDAAFAGAQLSRFGTISAMYISLAFYEYLWRKNDVAKVG